MKTYLYQIFGLAVILPSLLFSESTNDSTKVNSIKTDSAVVNQKPAAGAIDSTVITRPDEVTGTAVAGNDSKKTHEDTLDASDIAKKLSRIKTSFTTRLSKSRAQGYGGGVIISPMIGAMQMKPVHELALHDYILKKHTFSDLNDDYQPVLFTGGIAYGGVGNGLRIGLGGWSGEYTFESETFNDSIILLNMNQSFGGLFIERAFVKNNFNYLVGGILGLGSIEVKKTLSDDNAWEKVDDDDEEKATASFAGLNLHAGFTVTLLPWMHVGMDGNSLFMFSVKGFNITGCDGFSSVVPGVRLRIVLGNLG